MCFLIVDFKQNYTILSLYHTNKSIVERIKFEDEILIKNPHFFYVHGEEKGKIYSYPCIRVTSLNDILVNKEPLLNNYSKHELVTSYQ